VTDVLDRITSLVDKPFVAKQRQNGTMRFQMLEVVRGYATDRLQAGDEAESMLRNHATYFLALAVEDIDGHTADDRIRMVLGASSCNSPKRVARDQDNAIDAWPERGLLGTRLGPDKNGRKR
jgi:hypothetical protein